MKGFLLIWILWIGLIVNTLVNAKPVWIDTDPACGVSKTSDVDDCWALQLALKSSELDIRGISTVFGNSDGETSYAKTHEIISRIKKHSSKPHYFNDALHNKIYRGSDKALNQQSTKTTNASEALAKQLKQEPLTILALGPLTNIANLLQTHPELAGKIIQIIAVAGKRPDNKLGFYPGNTSLLHLHDFNFKKDVKAFEVVLNSSIPLTLIPYEVASKITITPSDIKQIQLNNPTSHWLAQQSKQWLAFWLDDLKAEGFFPFDSIAIAYAIDNEQFQCENLTASIKRKRSFFVKSRDDLLVTKAAKNGRTVGYCYDVKHEIKSTIINRL